jgi:hypothetical protein
MITLKYDTSIEVTKQQFEIIKNQFSWICAYRIDEQGKYWIKCLVMKYKNYVEQILNK